MRRFDSFSKTVFNFNFDSMTTMWLLEIFLNNPVELLQETFPADVMRTKSNQLLQSHENFRAAAKYLYYSKHRCFIPLLPPSQGFCRFDMTLTLASAWRKKGMFAWLFRKRKEPLRPIVDYCKGCCMLLLLLSHSPIDRTNEALPWSLTVRIASIEHTTSTLAALKHTGNSYQFFTDTIKQYKQNKMTSLRKQHVAFLRVQGIKTCSMPWHNANKIILSFMISSYW